VLGVVDGARFPWGFERDEGADWQPARIVASAVSTAKPEYSPVRLLTPAQLPAMIEQPVESMRVRFVGPASSEAIRAVDNRSDAQEQWQALIADGALLTLPPNTAQRVLIDLGVYTCAYPALVVSGGAGGELQLRWAEALYQEPQGHAKGQRDAVEGRILLRAHPVPGAAQRPSIGRATTADRTRPLER
jgi:hypothetical protein